MARPSIPMPKCKVDNCFNPAFNRKYSLCNKHYKRMRRHGDPEAGGRFREPSQGQGSDPLYSIWVQMVERCTNNKHPQYKNYGARGISVSKRWIDSFLQFKKDIPPRPEGAKREFSLDRINNNGNYEPGNVRWATAKEQLRNTRHNHMITYNGETKSLVEWAECLDIKYNTLCTRILTLKMPVKDAFSKTAEGPTRGYDGRFQPYIIK